MSRKPVCRSPFKLIVAILLVALVALSVPYSFMGGGGGTVIASGPIWTAMISGTTQTLYGVWTNASPVNASPVNATVVGGGGTILRYVSGAWSAMTSGVTNDLFAIWGSSETDMVSVGSWGKAVHYDGDAWTSKATGTVWGQMGVWGSSSADVFMVGYAGDIHHYDGASWTNMTSGTGNNLTSVWGSSATDVYAVGGWGTILHYDGNSWSSVSSGTIWLLNGVWGSSATDVFAVGANGTILHNSGSGWSAMSSGTTTELMDVWGSSATDVFAVGLNGTILHYNGSAWSAMESGTAEELRDVWGGSAHDVFAVGNSGTILHYAYPKPTISGVNPGSGQQGETLSVTISGDHLGDATAVGFGAGVTVNGFTVDSDSQITAEITVSDSAAVEARCVSVTAPGGTGTLCDVFVVNAAPPAIAAVIPASGVKGGTQPVTITGTYLAWATVVDFGAGITVNSFAADSSTQITASVTISESAALGVRDVSVTTPGGTATLGDGFSVVEAADGWYEQYMAGANNQSGVISTSWLAQTFTPVTTHTFNAVSLQLYKAGSPAYTVTISLYEAGTDDKPAGTALTSTTFESSSLATAAAWYDYQFATGYPVVAGTKYAIVLTATEGAAGNLVYWRLNTAGTYSRGMRAVSANQGVSWTTNAAHDFMFKEGQNPPVWYEQYTSGANNQSGVIGTSWLAQTFTPVTTHTFNTVSLQLYKAGSPAYTVTVSLYAAGADDKPVGTGLSSTTFEASSLTTTAGWHDYQFATPYPVVEGTKYAIVLSATGGASGNLVYWRLNTAGTYPRGMRAVSTNQGVSWTPNAAHDFMFKEGGSAGEPPPVPTVTGVSPGSGEQGETLTVTITGTDLTGATSVSFDGGITVNSYTVDSETQITAGISISAAAGTGTRDVSVTTPGGTGTLSGGFTVEAAPPTVSGVSPDSGGKGQTLTVVITGTGLEGATVVSFGSGVTVNSYTVDSAVQITAQISISGSATIGFRDVSVTTPGGTATLVGGFEVTETALPLIYWVSPISGVQGQSIAVTIGGSGLTGATVVSFGSGVTVNEYTVDSDSQISAEISIDSGAVAGARDVEVTTAGGTATLAGGFTVNPASANGWYEQYTSGANNQSGVIGTSWLGQTFTPGTTHTFDAVSLQLYKAGSPTYTVTVSLYAAGTDDKPTGAALTSTTFLASSLTTSAAWYEYRFSTGCAVVAGTKYAIVLTATEGAAGNLVYWRLNTAGAYGGGMRVVSTDQGDSWTTNSAHDFMFKEGQNPPVWYEEYTSGANNQSGVIGTSWLGQTFTPGTAHTFNAVSLQLYKAGSPTYTVTISLYLAGTDDKPTGEALTSTTFAASSLTTAAAWYEYQFTTGYEVAAGTKYAIVLSATEGAAGNLVYWRLNTAGAYSGGMRVVSTDQGVSWTTNSAHDFMFREGGSQ